jgi:precorrin-6Y C5,15-methyltransferase (decarboxylating)
MSKVTILGISDAGLDSLTSTAKQVLNKATFLAGGMRHLSFCNDFKVEKLIVKNNLKELAERLVEELKKPDAAPVVLASGDPLFYGVARFLINKLGSGQVEVLPYLSSMQLAFARVGLSWEDAQFISVHGRPLDNLSGLVPTAAKVGVFTDHENHPAHVATYLIALGWPKAAAAWVLEDLEGPTERMTRFSLEELAQRAGKDFSELNVVVAVRDAKAVPSAATAHAFGLPDDAFAQRKPDKGLITKSEVRAISLAKLRVFPGSVMWDIGAATGSVSIEAARLGARKVWALEKNAEDCDNVRENVARFHTPQVQVINGIAPDALAQIAPADDPDCVFIGGTAGRLEDILGACLARLHPGGSLVANFATIENIAEALAWFKASGLDWGFLQVQVSRGKPILDLHRLDALNPITVVWGYKS